MKEQWTSFLTYRRKTLVFFELFSVFANMLVLVLPIYSLQVFNRVLSSKSLETLLYLTVIACCLLLLQQVLEHARQRILGNLKNIYEATFDTNVLSIALSNTNEDPTEVLKKHRQAALYLSSPYKRAKSDLPWSIAFILVMFSLHPVLGSYALCTSILLILMIVMFSGSVRQLEMSYQHYKGVQRSGAARIVSQAVLARSLRISNKLIATWGRKNQHTSQLQLDASSKTAVLQSSIKLLRTLIQVGVYAVGAVLVIKGDVLAGALLASAILISRIVTPIELASQHYKEFQAQRDAFNWLNHILTSHKSVTKFEVELDDIKVRLQDVSFSCHERALLKSINFKLAQGKCLEIKGPMGSGKTLLMDTLSNRVQPTDGKVMFNDIDIRNIDENTLSESVGYLSQNPSFFNGTIAENICGFHDVASNSEKILATSEAVGLVDEVTRLPDNYNTVLESDDINLSQGQKQKLALARCFYGNPKLVLLDNPTVALDPTTKVKLLKTLISLKESGTTVIFISDDASLQSLADYVVELQEGTVVKGYSINKNSSGSKNVTDLKPAAQYQSITY
ncbi:ATP-binding cassette domain-containing protein [Vibrio maritimus]|uniref:ATP-binding cassette domain-containing protein n=1 Tax=Vibrio maritimus TaxID=990268 RepID=UPI00406897D3